MASTLNVIESDFSSLYSRTWFLIPKSLKITVSKSEKLPVTLCHTPSLNVPKFTIIILDNLFQLFGLVIGVPAVVTFLADPLRTPKLRGSFAVIAVWQSQTAPTTPLPKVTKMMRPGVNFTNHISLWIFFKASLFF